MAKKASLRQQNFAIGYLRSGNMYKSAISAGYSKSTAKNARVKILNLLSTQTYINEIDGTVNPIESTTEFYLKELKELTEQSDNKSVKLKALNEIAILLGMRPRRRDFRSVLNQ